MKLAVPALIALALLSGSTGCCFFHCGHGCNGLADGCDPVACDTGCGGCNTCHDGCNGMGCGPLHWILNWSRCHDCCDQCGHWTGPDMISHNRPPAVMEEQSMPVEYDEAPTEVSAGRVVPGSVRVTTRSAEPTEVVEAEASPRPVRRSASPSTRYRPKRITSSPMRSR